MPRSSIFSSSRSSTTPAADPPTSIPSPSTENSASPGTTFLHHSALLPRTFTDGLPLPSVLVFDLDYTLWPFWCDTHCTPPLKPAAGRDAGRAVKDRHGESFAFYPDVPGVLLACKQKGIKVAAASRTHAPDVAMDLLRLLVVADVEGGGSKSGGVSTKPAKDYFSNLQIYPGNKIAHMEGITKKLGVGYQDLLFFDDEERNRNVERERGVCFYLVRDGVTREEVDRGVERWRARRAKDAR